MTAPMPETMSPREKVELKPCPFCGGEAEKFSMADRVGIRCADVMCAGSHRLPSAGEDAAAAWNRRAALASSGDHAELARLAEAATPGPWVADVTSAKNYASVRRASGPATRTGKAAILRLQTALNSQRAGEAKADAAFIAAANPATVTALIAEVAALREQLDWMMRDRNAVIGERDRADTMMQSAEARATEAERKLAEAVGLLKRIDRTYADMQDGNGNHPTELRKVRTFLSKEAERG